MKPLFLPLAAAAVCVLLAHPALADDPKDVLLRAQQAQLAAPTCRMTMHSKDVDTGKVSLTVIETIAPDQMHMRQERDGQVKMEMVTDGKRTLIRKGADGPFTEAPAGVGAMLGSVRKSGFIQEMAGMAKDVQVAGHEVVNGQAATIYTFTTDMMGVHGSSKLWISDKDMLPLKAEGDSTGGVSRGSDAPASKPTSRHSEITFDYDPTIKITLPEA